MISALSFLSAALSAQTPITFEPQMDRVSKIVEALAAQTGRKLETSKNLGDTVIFIRAKDQPVQMVMDQMAKICLADWKDVGGTLYLSRSETVVAAQDKKDIEFIHKSMRKEVDDACLKLVKPKTEQERVDQLKKQESFYQRNRSDYKASQAFWREAQQAEAGNIAILLMLKNLDLHRIASLKPGERIVYSSNPTPMQFPLSMGLESIYRRFIVDQETNLRAAIQIQQASGNANADSIERMDQQIRELRPAKSALLTVDKDSSYFDAGTVQVTLQLLDAKGQSVGWGNYPLGSLLSFPFGAYWMPEATDTEPADPNAPAPVELDITTETKNMFESMNSKMRGEDEEAEPNKLEAQLAAKFNSPLQTDPLAVLLADVFTAYARKKDLNMVARIDDPYFLIAPSIGRTGKVTDQTVESALGDRIVKDPESGWTHVLPSTARQSLAENESRIGLDRLLKAVRSSSFVSIWDLGSYGLQLTSNNTLPLGPLLMWVAVQASELAGPETTGGNPSDPGLCLLTSLGQETRKRLAAGQKMTYAQLSPIQQEYVRRLTFSVNRSFTAGSPPDMSEEPRGMIEQTSDSESVVPSQETNSESMSSLEYEPTQILYRGIPLNSVIKLTARTDAVILSRSNDKRMRQEFQLDYQTIAYYMAMEMRPDLFKNDDGSDYTDSLTWWKNMEGFRVGSRTNYQITIQFDKSHFAQGYATEFIRDQNAKFAKIEQLPKTIRDQINKQVVDLIKQYEEAKKNKGKEGQGDPEGSTPGTKP